MEALALKDRENQIFVKGESTFDIVCNKDSLAGAVSQRACVFCGSRVVLYPIADAVHLVHGPIGCAVYTWDIRGALCLRARTAPPLLFHRPPGNRRHLRRREKTDRRPARADRTPSAQGRLCLLDLHRRHHRRRPGSGLPNGRGRVQAFR